MPRWLETTVALLGPIVLLNGQGGGDMARFSGISNRSNPTCSPYFAGSG